MQFLKVVQPGWETYTGSLLGVEFVNGMSLEPVPARTAAALGSILQVETDSGTNPSASQQMIDRMGDSIAVIEPLQQSEEQPEAPVKPSTVYTREELESIADRKGLNGLREIADALGIKARGIGEMIDRILATQG